MTPLAWVLVGPTLVDATGSRRVDALVVRDGTIVHIGALGPEHDGLPTTEASGKFVTPGLIDAHVHLSMAPGGAFAERSEAEIRARRAHHLRAYVASGVTAVLDTGIPLDDAHEILELAEAGPAPEVRMLGPLLSPPDGYVHAVLPDFPPATDVETVQAQLEAFDPLGPIGVKVTMEDGMLRPIWDLHSDDVLGHLAQQDRPLFVHAMEPHEYEHALDHLPVRAFVHPLDDPKPAIVERLADIPVVTTLAVLDTLLYPAEPVRADAPHVRLTVPEDEWSAARDKDRIKRSNHAVVDSIMPKSPGFVRGLTASLLTARGPIRRRTRKLQDAVRTLHESGVELVLGSDSGNWPVFLFEFHGPTTIRELELLEEAGIPSADVLRIATLNPARLLRLEDTHGTLEVGKSASFVVLPTDPLVSVSAFRDPDFVAHRGELRTPAEWMAE